MSDQFDTGDAQTAQDHAEDQFNDDVAPPRRRSLKFAEMGKWYGGVIVEFGPKVQAQTYVSKADQAKGKFSAPKTYPGGTDPVFKRTIVLQTEEREAPNEDFPLPDDGIRVLHLEDSRDIYNVVKACSKQFKNTTGQKVVRGGTLVARWVSGKGEEGDRKLHEAHYTPPGGATGTAKPATTQPAVAQPAATNGGTSDFEAQMLLAGWAAMTPEQKETAREAALAKLNLPDVTKIREMAKQLDMPAHKILEMAGVSATEDPPF